MPLPQVLSVLTHERVHSILTENERIWNGKHTIYSNQVASNAPIEDRYDVKQTDHGILIGVFDGHGGDDTVQLVQKHLLSYVAHELKSNDPSTALKSAFQKLDFDILNGVISLEPIERSYLDRLFGFGYRQQVLKRLQQNFTGSCAIVALVQEDDIYVACTGDSRAVLGQKQVFLSSKDLSQDQTPELPTERQRLESGHPGEAVIRSRREDPTPRVLGLLMCSRAFGDAYLKYPTDLLYKLGRYGLRVPKDYKSPPYLTADPVIQHHKRTSSDKMLILATDGLWETISSLESVQIAANTQQPATDLIKAAIGGPQMDPDYIRQSLSITYPMSRNIRDDITEHRLKW
ncbi:phosphatase 2C-like domain-containing protein [Gorgonomyces haynaldii]|nr:phosphatase 2C-like domain-containing protein [Gorgonomyces haynaldii]